MKLGTRIVIYHRENDYTDYPAIKQHGYDYADHSWFFNINNPLFSCDDTTFERILAKEAQCAAKAGVKIHQVHAPWPFPLPDYSEETLKKRLWEAARTIWGTSLLGAKFLVIHPLFPEGCSSKKYMAINRDFFEKLLPIAAQHDVIVCLENMPFTDSLLATPTQIANFVQSFDSPYFKVCLDTGHCSILGIDVATAVHELGKDLLAVLHVHDNNGTDDQHAIPGNGIIDWKSFIRALDDIGYEGVFSLEVSFREAKTREETYALSAILARETKEMLI